MKKFKVYFLTFIFIFLSLGFGKLPSLEAGNKISNSTSVKEITFPMEKGYNLNHFLTNLKQNMRNGKIIRFLLVLVKVQKTQS